MNFDPKEVEQAIAVVPVTPLEEDLIAMLRAAVDRVRTQADVIKDMQIVLSNHRAELAKVDAVLRANGFNGGDRAQIVAGMARTVDAARKLMADEDLDNYGDEQPNYYAGYMGSKPFEALAAALAEYDARNPAQ